jgi:hypothetical protein
MLVPVKSCWISHSAAANADHGVATLLYILKSILFHAGTAFEGFEIHVIDEFEDRINRPKRGSSARNDRKAHDWLDETLPRPSSAAQRD